MKYYIYAPSYDENSGGCLVLHRLCHLINQVEGNVAFLVPRVPEELSIVKGRYFLRDMYRIIMWFKEVPFFKYRFKTNQLWDTPVKLRSEINDLDESIVIYPEVTHGNPLNAKNVVRWLLHQPGHFTKVVCIGVGELHFKFNSAIKDFVHCLSTLSKQELKVIYYPLELYNMDNATNNSGCCHLVRKGKDKKKCHPEDSIAIDELSHKQISEIFKKCKRFICYDDYTAYSIFAVLCGCESIVVPGEGISKEQWYPRSEDRYGLAYGFSEDELSWAEKTKNKVLEHILNEHQHSMDNVLSFIEETKSHFNNISI